MTAFSDVEPDSPGGAAELPEQLPAGHQLKPAFVTYLQCVPAGSLDKKVQTPWSVMLAACCQL